MFSSLILAAAAIAAPQCGAIDQNLPPNLAAWRNAVPAPASIGVGKAYAMTLKPSPQIEYRPAGRQPKADSFGGFVPLRIARPGKYGVAFSHAAWIDLTRGKEPALQSAAHGHGPACTSIRKIVDFDLRAGAYLVQISDSPSASVKLLVIRR